MPRKEETPGQEMAREQKNEELDELTVMRRIDNMIKRLPKPAAKRAVSWVMQKYCAPAELKIEDGKA